MPVGPEVNVWQQMLVFDALGNLSVIYSVPKCKAASLTSAELSVARCLDDLFQTVPGRQSSHGLCQLETANIVMFTTVETAFCSRTKGKCLLFDL